MKRILFGLAWTCAFGGSVFAQPAARLGVPAATLGQPVPPPIIRAAAPDDPKVDPKTMPKAGINEAPKPGMLSMPSEVNPMLGGTPGAITPSGPILTGPPGSMVVPNGPILSGPVIAQPPVPGGLMPPVPGGGVLPHEVCPNPIIASPVVDEKRWYTSAEFLIWYVRSYTVPSLVTIGQPGTIGAAGENGVTSAFGGGSLVEQNPRYGGRISLGYWFCPKWAIDVNAFMLPTVEKNFGINSQQFPNSVIARPFFSVNQNIEFAEQVANPGIYSGGVSVNSKSFLFGLDANLRRHLWQGENTTIDGIFGYRYLSLREELSIKERTIGLAGAPRIFQGVERAIEDNFHTRNAFHGAQIGGILEHRWGRWTVDLRLKVAAGVTIQEADVSGATSVIRGGTTPNQAGGLLALSTNSGSYSRTPFAIVPEGSLNLGYDLTSHLRLFVGYNFLYWSSVTRPGSQIDRNLDENRIPDFTLGRNVPAAQGIRPVTKVEPESFWAQGITFGLMFRW